MADFNPDRAIYLQLADRLADMILEGRCAEGERMPSIRECAVQFGVNNNTAVKSFEYLARAGVIYNQRGMGYYVSSEAPAAIRRERREEFLRHTLPEVFRQMRLVGVTLEEVAAAYSAEAGQ